MRKLRLLLIPFGWIYGLITASRNVLFSAGVLKSHAISVKSICVGNLSVGGTGKTPHVDLLLEHFLSKGKKIATLSRGYGRKTKGLIEVNPDLKASEAGDEPLQYKLKYGSSIHVICAEKRLEGINFIQKNYPETDLILLDDAFQHRAVKAGLNIILTEYSNLFVDDFMIPAGNLREWGIGIKRADLIIVSKCPLISPEEKSTIIQKLGFDSEKIFFSHIAYGHLKGFNNGQVPRIKNILLVSGIGNPDPLFSFLKNNYNVEHLKYRDHHLFTMQDIADIHEKFDNFATSDKIVVTTEKDFMRIKDLIDAKDSENWFYLPITTIIDEQEKFNHLIDGYINEI